MAKACKANGTNHLTLAHLRGRFPEIEAAYKTAVEIRGEAIADEILGLADQPIAIPEDTPEDQRAPMYRALLAKRQLEVDTRKWVSGRMYARMYGDRAGGVTVTQTVNVGSIGEAIKAAVEARRSPKVVDVDPETGEIEDAKVASTEPCGGRKGRKR